MTSRGLCLTVRKYGSAISRDEEDGSEQTAGRSKSRLGRDILLEANAEMSSRQLFPKERYENTSPQPTVDLTSSGLEPGAYAHGPHITMCCPSVCAKGLRFCRFFTIRGFCPNGRTLRPESLNLAIKGRDMRSLKEATGLSSRRASGHTATPVLTSSAMDHWYHPTTDYNTVALKKKEKEKEKKKEEEKKKKPQLEVH
ncbi:hypothetical protein TREES_T100007245 [Tupaia chinensis]|uniref:Uncharacterized protein n=1 Tax=Tupaia chinensis TaxID=246437 RepID=L9L193_TUPCH|nr:hypothetical protein TREES_T100007245 [Tupaia chinensis]